MRGQASLANLFESIECVGVFSEKPLQVTVRRNRGKHLIRTHTTK